MLRETGPTTHFAIQPISLRFHTITGSNSVPFVAGLVSCWWVVSTKFALQVIIFLQQAIILLLQALQEHIITSNFEWVTANMACLVDTALLGILLGLTIQCMLQCDACTGNWLGAIRHIPKLAKLIIHSELACRAVSWHDTCAASQLRHAITPCNTLQQCILGNVYPRSKWFRQ